MANLWPPGNQLDLEVALRQLVRLATGASNFAVFWGSWWVQFGGLLAVHFSHDVSTLFDPIYILQISFQELNELVYFNGKKGPDVTAVIGTCLSCLLQDMFADFATSTSPVAFFQRDSRKATWQWKTCPPFLVDVLLSATLDSMRWVPLLYLLEQNGKYLLVLCRKVSQLNLIGFLVQSKTINLKTHQKAAKTLCDNCRTEGRCFVKWFVKASHHPTKWALLVFNRVITPTSRPMYFRCFVSWAMVHLSYHGGDFPTMAMSQEGRIQQVGYNSSIIPHLS